MKKKVNNNTITNNHISTNKIIIFNILKYLNVDTIYSCELVNKKWNEISNSNNLWELFIMKMILNQQDEKDKSQINSVLTTNNNNKNINYKQLYHLFFPHQFNRIKNINLLKKNNLFDNKFGFSFEPIDEEEQEEIEQQKSNKKTKVSKKEMENLFNNRFDKKFINFTNIVNNILFSLKFNKSKIIETPDKFDQSVFNDSGEDYEEKDEDEEEEEENEIKEKARLFKISDSFNQIFSINSVNTFQNDHTIEFVIFIPNKVCLPNGQVVIEYSRIIKANYNFLVQYDSREFCPTADSQDYRGELLKLDYNYQFMDLNDDGIPKFKDNNPFALSNKNDIQINVKYLGFNNLKPGILSRVKEITKSKNEIDAIHLFARDTISLYTDNIQNEDIFLSNFNSILEPIDFDGISIKESNLSSLNYNINDQLTQSLDDQDKHLIESLLNNLKFKFEIYLHYLFNIDLNNKERDGVKIKKSDLDKKIEADELEEIGKILEKSFILKSSVHCDCNYYEPNKDIFFKFEIAIPFNNKDDDDDDDDDEEDDDTFLILKINFIQDNGESELEISYCLIDKIVDNSNHDENDDDYDIKKLEFEYLYSKENKMSRSTTKSLIEQISESLENTVPKLKNFKLINLLNLINFDQLISFKVKSVKPNILSISKPEKKIKQIYIK